jgi:signal peptidase
MTAPFINRLPHATTTAAPPPAHAHTPWAKALRILVGTVTSAMILVAVAAFLFLAVGPRFLGYQTSTMLTGSMAPLINPGDVVVSVAKPASELRTGDIITYGIPVDDRRIETHRIVEIIRNANGTTAVRTKGDANNGADPWTAVLQEDTVHVQAVTIPYLGTAIRTLRDPIVLKVLMYGAPAVLVIMMLASIWGKKPEANPSPTDPSNAGKA